MVRTSLCANVLDRGEGSVSVTARIVLFAISLLSMAGLAAAALLMAQNRWALGGWVGLLAFVVMAVGFVVRRKTMRW